MVSFRRDRKLSGKRPRGTTALYAKSRLIRKLARFDQIVEYTKPVVRPRWISAAGYAELPETLQVRELRYWTKHRGYRTRCVTLVTTLVDPKAYPHDELAALYGRRWEVETNLNHLKTTMGMNVLHCETVAGVLKELLMFALVYNLVRLVMAAAAEQQGVDVRRISFIDALRWLAQARAGDILPALQIVPHRPPPYRGHSRPSNGVQKNTASSCDPVVNRAKPCWRTVLQLNYMPFGTQAFCWTSFWKYKSSLRPL